MKTAIELVLALAILVGVYLLTQRIVIWRLQRTCNRVLRDLQAKGAFSPESAVPLPYAHKNPLRIGVRDYRPKAVEILLIQGKVATNEDGAYYLNRSMTAEASSAG